MIFRQVRTEEKVAYNASVSHPLQSWEWGEFRQKTGLQVERVGVFEGSNLTKGIQVTFHPIPYIGRTAGYLPKSFMPDEEQLSSLREIGKRHKALFVKLEPNVANAVDTISGHEHIQQFLIKNGAVPGKPLFTKYSFIIDLTKSEDELLASMSSKTRYNVRLAQKKGVKIFEQTSREGMEQYLEILKETTNRQGFYAHGPQYFRTMWETLGNSGMIRIFNAIYEDTVIASWIVFVFNGVLYYPYGASRAIHRDVMASNLLLWEMIRFGKENGCTSFDLWGSLGPNPDTNHPWYGFHKFKMGFGGTLVEFVGSYDLVIDEPLYQIFTIVDSLRWKALRLRSQLPF